MKHSRSKIVTALQLALIAAAFCAIWKSDDRTVVEMIALVYALQTIEQDREIAALRDLLPQDGLSR